MAPKVRQQRAPPTPSKNKDTKGGSRRGFAGRVKRIPKSRVQGRRIGSKIKLRGWLATPADWARFDAWAKVNALPKKIPEPPPMARRSKPLSVLRKHAARLAKPRIAPSVPCNDALSISRSALSAVASKRTIYLALPNIRLPDYGRVFYEVSPGALTYEPSPRILALSRPKSSFSSYSSGKSEKDGKSETTTLTGDKWTHNEEAGSSSSRVDRLSDLATRKKRMRDPNHLTPEEIESLFTPYGTRRTALAYQATPWLKFLSIPKYEMIKERKDPTAITWKKTIIEEGEERGRIALTEQRKKQGVPTAGKRKSEETSNGDAKRRKMEKHAWRYAPPAWKEDIFVVKAAALKHEASERTKALARKPVRVDNTSRPDYFVVKKSALAVTASERIQTLAKPPRPREPVERRPPREKDKYGRPIFQMPVHERVLPRTRKYKMGKCPPPEEKDNKVAEKRPIDPIVYEATYDPCVHPRLARRQKLERKRAENLSEGKKRRSKARGRARRKVTTTKEE